MKKVHVIQHTHWDFEWYFTRNEAIVQFVYHMDEVFQALQEQKVDYYLLDGQMSILDDYLNAYPEKKAEIIKWVHAGRLFIGPWYTQTDELIITGESIIRNLSLGMNLADSLGGSQKIGYLPDSFGQGADMPKIYQGMGIDSAVFWRGLPADKTTAREFTWHAEDGSEVEVVNIKDGYFVGVGLIYDDNAKNLMKTIVDGTSIDDIVLPVGGDQRYVDTNLKARIDMYNQQLKADDIKLIESNYPKYFDTRKNVKLDKVSGEFITSSVSKIHRSIYSSRYDHKYLNDKLERRMIYQLEPLMVMADRIGIPYKKSLLDKIWKIIVRNHAHDSAGGCNSDKTNEIILERLREADQLSYSTLDYLTRKIAESQQNKQLNDLTFFNTLPYPITKNIKFQISLKSQNFEIYDESKKLPVDVWRMEKKYHGQIRRDESKYEAKDYYYIFDCSANLTIPALQWKTLKIKELVGQKSIISNQDVNFIQNDKFKIMFNNGQLDLINMQTQEKVANFLRVIDDGDEGDTYDYSPAYQNKVVNLDFGNAKVQKKSGDFRQVMIIDGTWSLPMNLRERSSDENTGKVSYKLILELDSSKLVKAKLLLNNQVEDHRMRLILQTNISQNQSSFADTPFGYIERPVIDKHLDDWQKIGWHEEPSAIYPMLHYVNIHNDETSWTVFSKGVKEYQITGDDFNQIALTLFRSVGYLGRPDLIRRPGVASGNQFTYIPTPESQLKETLQFKFAFSLEDQFAPAALMKSFQQYAISNPTYQIQDLNQFTNTLKYFVMHPLNKQIVSKPFFRLTRNDLLFSSLTESVDQSGWLVRIYNPNKFEISGENVLSLQNDSLVSLTDFQGHIIENLGIQQNVSVSSFKPGEIKTIKINKEGNYGQ